MDPPGGDRRSQAALDGLTDGYATYREAEARLMRRILARSRSVSRATGLDVQDAVQEGRVALWRCLSAYQSDRGPLEGFAGRVLDNFYRDLLVRTVAQKRMQRIAVRDGDGWTTVPVRPLPLEVDLAADVDAPDVAYFKVEAAALADDLLTELSAALDTRDRRVLRCKMSPPRALLKETRGEVPSDLQVARHLKLSLEAVRWSLRRIRRVTRRLLHCDRYRDLEAKT